MNKKFARFVINFISVQLVFNNWYPFSTQFALSPFAKNIPEEVQSASKNNQMILINICIVCGFIIGLLSNLFTHIFSVGIKQKLDEKNPDGTSVFQFKHDNWKEFMTLMDDKMLTNYYELLSET